MSFLCIVLLSLILTNASQTLKHLPEISLDEELPIGSLVTSLTDKIPNLDQSLEYDLVTPLSTDLDFFAVNHQHHSLVIQKRIDYETVCFKEKHCVISVSIAVSNAETIDVYILPIRLVNINDNILHFLVNRTVIEIEENDDTWPTKRYSLPQAYDADGDPITYSIYLQNWMKPEGLFAFDASTFSLKPLKKFDREEQNIYLLRLIAHNQNDASTDIIVLINDVNDNAPICQSNHTVFLISNISPFSTLTLNATDADEGDNGKLNFRLVNAIAGFSIDRYNGQIKFDYKKWVRSNDSTLIVNITDSGKSVRFSTTCSIEIRYTFLFDIGFRSSTSRSNQTVFEISVRDVEQPLGRFVIYDKQKKTSCSDCFVRVNSSVPDIFRFNDVTYDLYYNLNSVLLMKLLTNYAQKEDRLLVDIQMEIMNFQNPSIVSSKTFSFRLHLNKFNILHHSNIFFLKLNDDLPLYERIPISGSDSSCLTNQSKDFSLIDPTNTFDIDGPLTLILNKYLNTAQQNVYRLTLQEKRTNHTNEVQLLNNLSQNVCSIQLYIYVLDPYSNANVYPYFSQSFYILANHNLSHFSLPRLPSHVKYVSSVPKLISVDPFDGSIIIRSSSLYAFYYYDFQIQALDDLLPSLNSAVSVRIYFGINEHAPRLLINSTRQALEVSSSNFLYQVIAYDPDIIINDQTSLHPPAMEFQIDPSTNIEIERFTGRIFLKDPNQTKINFTVIVTDFGQPNRLSTRQVLIFDIQSNVNLSTSFVLICASILSLVIFLSIVILLVNCCYNHRRQARKAKQKNAWKNISPTTADSRLIDNEYMTTTTTATLPRVSSREQRTFPALSYVHLNQDTQQQARRISSHLSLDKINLHYSSAERMNMREDFEQRLSMADVNRYLERFEKIYNDSSSQQHLHQPRGSVV